MAQFVPSSDKWTTSNAGERYGKSIGAAERVHPGIQAGKAALKSDFEKYDTALSRGSILKPAGKEHLFGARYYTKSEEEKQWQLRNEATAVLGGAFKNTNVVVQATVPDKYVEWIEAKQKAEFYLGYDKWIEEQFLDGDLAKREFIKQAYPEYFEAREAEVAAKQALDKKIFDIKLHGPRDAEDLRLQYMLQTGAIIPDPTPIWDSSAGQGMDGNVVLQRGFMSTHKWLLNTPIHPAKATNIPFSADGTSATAKAGFATGPKWGSVHAARKQGESAFDGNFSGVPNSAF